MTAIDLDDGDRNLLVSGLGRLLADIRRDGEEFTAPAADVVALRDRLLDRPTQGATP